MQSIDSKLSKLCDKLMDDKSTNDFLCDLLTPESELPKPNELSFSNGKKHRFNSSDFTGVENIASNPGRFVERYYHNPTNLNVVIKFVQVPNNRQLLRKEYQEKYKKLFIEVDILKKLDHPNIIDFYGFCMHPEYLLIFMESMDFSLTDLYRKAHELYDHFPEELLVYVASKIVDALLACNEKRITHRDIKPDNILVNVDSRVKLCDFGVSRILNETTICTTVGTRPYMSPEFYTNERYGPKVDVWSLGVTIFEAAEASFNALFENNDHGVLHGKHADPMVAIKNMKNSYSEDLKEFLSLCLTINVDNRPRLAELTAKTFYKNGLSDDILDVHIRSEVLNKSGLLFMNQYMSTNKVESFKNERENLSQLRKWKSGNEYKLKQENNTLSQEILRLKELIHELNIQVNDYRENTLEKDRIIQDLESTIKQLIFKQKNMKKSIKSFKEAASKQTLKTQVVHPTNHVNEPKTNVLTEDPIFELILPRLKENQNNALFQARSGHKTFLSSGYLYAIGGFNPETLVLKDMWRMDLKTKQWEICALSNNLPEELASFALAQVTPYHTIIFGGTGYPWGMENSNQLYSLYLSEQKVNVVLEKVTGEQPFGTFGSALIPSNDSSTFYLIGGCVHRSFHIHIWKLERKTTWHWTALTKNVDLQSMPNGRYKHEAFMHGNLILIFGGSNKSIEPFNKITAFDTTYNDFSYIMTIPDPIHGYPETRRQFSAIKHQNHVFIFGGLQENKSILGDIWRIDLSDFHWHKLNSTMPIEVYFHSSNVSEDGSVYVFGGITGDAVTGLRTSVTQKFAIYKQ